ncbi:MAG: hypothetical protein ACI9JL_003756 [Paracoccaceae bacterium]|jgi:hypothetical protein
MRPDTSVFRTDPIYLRALLVSGLALAILIGGTMLASANPTVWKLSWPDTDFSRKSIEFGEIISGGPPKDGIPSIDKPIFVPQAKYQDGAETEPVITFAHKGDARAYPLRVLMWHEIVNDTVGGLPVSVTYCPLCNSSVVFDRRLGNKILDFGTTGKLRKSDMVMYDRQTESWWQQFTGTGIVGEMTGKMLTMLPARVESLAKFRARYPGGKVLVPNNPDFRPYGNNPYLGYDSSSRPFLYRGEMPKGIAPLAYVVKVGDQAWSLEKLKKAGKIVAGDLILTWSKGLNSALDMQEIREGRDIGNVVVQRKTFQGMREEVHDLTFAFVFHAFVEGGTIHK